MSRIPRSLWISLLLVSVLGLVVACAPAPTPAPTSAPPTSAPAATAPAATKPAATTAATSAPSGTAKKIVIGFTASQTGSLNVESTKQVQGLQLWLDDVTKAGGIKLKDGTVIMPSLKFYDDQSAANRIQSLYTQLINQDKVDFLISPYGSGLAKAAAVVSEQYSKLMITTGAADDATMEQGFKNTYQLYTPASLYLAGAIDLLGKIAPSAKKIAIAHENDAFSSTVAKYADEYAKAHGYTVVMDEGYDTGTTDFSALINKIAAASPDAIMGGGHFADGSTFAKQLYEKKVPAQMLALLVAPPEPTFTQIGDAAQYVIGPSQWEPQVTYSADAAKAANLPWYGISVKDFTAEFKAKYNADPSYHAAGGYAAGLLLQKAIEDTNGVDPTAIKADLDKTDLLTFYGHIKFSTDAKTHGKQIGHEMVYMQWQKDASGKFVKQIVWPASAKTADAQLRK
ncbi:MAG: amino acid ABC transporter substrate-binding protein [Chloroflexi bacterium]|nr:amino acid ABC transporter substrate-binding protein [Chloroflexota bacterium]